MIRLLLLAIVLSGCTVNLVDKRLTREEVAAAFKQRDAALEVLALAVEELKKPSEAQAAKPKE